MGNLKPLTRFIFEGIRKDKNIIQVEGLSNPVEINGDVATVYCLYKEQVFRCLIDVEDLHLLRNTGTWVVRSRKQTKVKYVLNGANGSLHRYLTNCPKGMEVDHINRDGLDNRQENIRVVTQAINMTNKKVYKNSSTGIANVHIEKDKYRVSFIRKYNSKNLAEMAAIEIKDILDKYSQMDIKKNEVKHGPLI